MSANYRTRKGHAAGTPLRPGRSSAEDSALPGAAPAGLAPSIERAEAAPGLLSSAEVQRLQRALGNRAVSRLLSAAPLQRQIIAAGGEGAGRMEEPERASFDQLLTHNGLSPATFTAADYAALKGQYDKLAPLDKKVVDSKAAKKISAKADLKEAYDKLLANIQAAVLGEGKPTWDAALGLAVQQYKALPAIEQKNTDKQYQDIATPIWPTVGGRGAMPESFWKSVKKAIKTGFAAAAGGALAFSAECNTIYADMDTQFTAWDGSLAKRGAWWGSAAPGVTAGAKDVPSTTILELQQKAAGSAWKFSNSFSGGLSFHKTRGTVDFIYHMQSAP